MEKKQIESKTKSYQPRRKTSQVERTFQESARKPTCNHWRIKIIPNGQQYVELGQSTEKEIDTLSKKKKKWKQKSCRPWSLKDEKIDEILLRLYYAVYKQNTIEKWTNGCILSFLKKGDPGITKNYRGITQSAKVYCTSLLNRISPKFFRKNQNSFWRNLDNSTDSNYPSNHQECKQRISRQHYFSLISPKYSI